MLRRLALLPFLALCSLAVGQGSNATFTGRVVGVSDGDTLKVLRETARRKEEVRVRLWGVDAPETKQAFGTKSKQFTSDLVFGKSVTVLVADTDRYGRTVAWVTVGSGGEAKALNLELLKAGMGWWYESYAKKAYELRDAMEAAKRAKVGLWSEPNPVAPWEFRKSARGS